VPALGARCPPSEATRFRDRRRPPNVEDREMYKNTMGTNARFGGQEWGAAARARRTEQEARGGE
jgi:hypothetical protein